MHYDAEDLDLIMLMHSLLENSANYSGTTSNFQYYSKDKAIDVNAEIEYTNTLNLLSVRII